MCIWLILFSFFKLSQITRLAWANNSFYWLWRTWVGDLAHIAFCRSSLWTHKSQDEPRLDYASKCKIWPKLFLLAYFFPLSKYQTRDSWSFSRKNKEDPYLVSFGRLLKLQEVNNHCSKWCSKVEIERWTHSGQNSSWIPNLQNTYFPLCLSLYLQEWQIAAPVHNLDDKNLIPMTPGDKASRGFCRF